MRTHRMHRKYGNKKYTTEDGITFDSLREACRWSELVALQKAGVIHDLKRQVKFVLIPTQREEGTEVYKRGEKAGQKKPGKMIESECAYYADFCYYEGNGQYVVEDSKGFRTPEYVMKRKLMLYRYGIRIKET